MKINPMPIHGESSFNAIEEVYEQEMIMRVEEIQTPLTVIWVQLIKHDLIPTNHDVTNDSASDTNTNEG